MIFKLIYLFSIFLIIYCQNNQNKREANSSLPNSQEDDKGNFMEDFFSVLLGPVAQIFSGTTGKCAIYEGFTGACKGNPFNCPNLGNGTKTKCIYGLSQVGTCCPTQPFREMVPLPKLTVQCGIRTPYGIKGRVEGEIPSNKWMTNDWLNENEDSSEELTNEVYDNGDNDPPKLSFFIVGGKEAVPMSWPWAVQIQFKSPRTGNFTHICGGTIINEWYVMTAAHCCLSLNPRDFKLKIGAYRLKDRGEIKDVEKITVHEGYTSSRHQNDIALFKFKNKINWRAGVAPICLPSLDMQKLDLTGRKSMLIGWGTTSFGGKVSNDLREVDVPIVTNSKCSEANDHIFSGADRISEKQMCAGYEEGGKDTCQGDSGGPLLVPFNDRWVQMGIVSYGNGCAKPRFPGVYTRVSYFVPWIALNIQKDFIQNPKPSVDSSIY